MESGRKLNEEIILRRERERERRRRRFNIKIVRRRVDMRFPTYAKRGSRV